MSKKFNLSKNSILLIKVQVPKKRRSRWAIDNPWRRLPYSASKEKTAPRTGDSHDRPPQYQIRSPPDPAHLPARLDARDPLSGAARVGGLSQRAGTCCGTIRRQSRLLRQSPSHPRDPVETPRCRFVRKERGRRPDLPNLPSGFWMGSEEAAPSGRKGSIRLRVLSTN